MHYSMNIAITVLHERWLCGGMQRQTLLTPCNQGTFYTCIYVLHMAEQPTVSV